MTEPHDARIDHASLSLERYVDVARAGLVVLDRAGTIRYANAVAHDLLGPRDRVGEQFGLPLVTDGVQRIELRDRWGSYRVVTMTVTELVGHEEGQEDGYVVALQDLTEATGLAEATEQRLEADRELSDVAFRELHDSLGGLTWALQTLQRRWDSLGEGDRRDQLHALDRRVDSMSATVAGYLVPEAPETATETTLADLVEERLDDLGDPATVRAAVQLAIPAHLRAAAEPAHVWTMLRSLLENAVDHGRAPILVIGLEHEDEVSLVVVDHGPGVSAARRQDLFERRRSRNGRSEVTGGLWTTRMLAERVGGTVGYQPHPPGGSRFLLTLPAAPA